MHVRLARSAINISQKDLSNHTSISVSSIARLEQSENYFQKTTKIIKRSLFDFYTQKKGIIFLFDDNNGGAGIRLKEKTTS